MATCNYNVTLEKVKHGWLHCMYNVYKLPHKIFIFNSFATIIQLTDFLTCQFIYTIVIPKR
jgi:hypothetical protein